MTGPRLRSGLQAIPYRHDGEQLVVVTDGERLADDYPAPAAVYLMLALIDGTRDAAALRADYRQRFGQAFASALLDELLAFLDARLLLDNERSAGALAALRAEYLTSSVRPASHAGTSYPAEPEALRRLLDGLFAAPPGEAAPPGGLVGVLSPHIDPRCGGPTYARAFEALAGAAPFERVVVLGIAHQATTTNPYIVTRRDFETPLGRLQTDQAFVDRLAERCGERIFEGEYAHRYEHSIEFQLVFLQHVLRGATPPSIVPVLCGPLQRHVERQSSPAADPEVAGFLDALAEAAAELPGRTVFVAGVDLSHVGPKFGHQRAVDVQFLQETSRGARQPAHLDRTLRLA